MNPTPALISIHQSYIDRDSCPIDLLAGVGLHTPRLITPSPMAPDHCEDRAGVVDAEPMSKPSSYQPRRSKNARLIVNSPPAMAGVSNGSTLLAYFFFMDQRPHQPKLRSQSYAPM
uniref:Uncharacterized protein n=1 Tax=Anopheles atroparvus TaxID=41427 RepID=A0A182JMC5_ANOAO